MNNQKKHRLLLHTCCAPCFTAVFDQLRDKYDITIYWFNTNIYPLDEYIQRLEELSRYAKIVDIPLVINGDYIEDHHSWVKMTQENSNEPEGGKRCEKCIKYRLLNTAVYAKENHFDAFATTLSVSPHKSTEMINKIGQAISKNLEIDFLAKDFKKNDGYNKSIEICKEYSIYRQKYCGCEYSRTVE